MLNSTLFDLGTEQRVTEVYKSTLKTAKAYKRKVLILQAATHNVMLL